MATCQVLHFAVIVTREDEGFGALQPTLSHCFTAWVYK